MSLMQTIMPRVDLNPVSAVATSNVAGTYYNGPANSGVEATLTLATGAFTLDGVTPALGDRILLAGQTSAYQNGVYIINQLGETGVTTVLKRAPDFQSVEHMVPGFTVAVSGGTLRKGAMYVMVAPQPAKVGTDQINFSTGSVNGGGTITVGQGGTGATTASTALTNLNVKRAISSIYGGGGTSHTYLATGLLATDIVVVTIRASTNSVAVAKAVPSLDALTITFTADPGANTTVQWIAVPAV